MNCLAENIDLNSSVSPPNKFRKGLISLPTVIDMSNESSTNNQISPEFSDSEQITTTLSRAARVNPFFSKEHQNLIERFDALLSNRYYSIDFERLLSLTFESIDVFSSFFRTSDEAEQELVARTNFSEKDLLSPLVSNFEIRGHSDVARFLKRHRNLSTFLGTISKKIGDYFGPETGLALRTICDPEESNDVSLIVLIQSTKEVDETLNCLKAFDEGWWLDASRPWFSLISVNTEYV